MLSPPDETMKSSFHFGSTLLIGIIIGFGLGCLLLTSHPGTYDSSTFLEQPTNETETEFYENFDEEEEEHTFSEADLDLTLHSPIEKKRTASSFRNLWSHRGDEDQDDFAVSIRLANEIPVLCWIMMSPDEVDNISLALHVKRTWGQRCNKLLFMSSESSDSRLPSIVLENEEGSYNTLFDETKDALKYLYANHFNDFDWFLKADEDTFVIMENLRFMLKDYNPNHPIHFGCKFKHSIKDDYMSGCSNYVLSKGALQIYIEESIKGTLKCGDETGAEDLVLGNCLESIGVEAGDSRDNYGRFRFLPFGPNTDLIADPSNSMWSWKNNYYPLKGGIDRSSDTAVSFHNVRPTQMYVLDYMIYHVRPYGVSIVHHNLTFSHPKHPLSMKNGGMTFQKK